MPLLTERRRAFAVQRFGDSVKLFSSGAEFYDSGMEVDGVWVISKEKTHTELAVPALERGLPLICEKPLSTTLEDAYRICDAYEAHPVPFVIPHRHEARGAKFEIRSTKLQTNSNDRNPKS